MGSSEPLPSGKRTQRPRSPPDSGVDVTYKGRCFLIESHPILDDSAVDTVFLPEIIICIQARIFRTSSMKPGTQVFVDVFLQSFCGADIQVLTKMTPSHE